jgi:NTE family protein
MTRSTPTAFVLSGGASLGAVQVGMLRALYERQIRPDLIVATSAGAINGAFIASRPQTVETADELAAIWGEVRRAQVFPLNPLSGLLGFLGSRAHMVPESGLRRLVAARVEHERLEELPIPLHVVAVDVITGEELLLSSGPVVDAVMASAAIPAVLPAVEWGDLELMDGGVANNTPISRALERPPGSALGMALHALSLLTHSRLIADIELHRTNAKLVVLPPPCPLSILPVDFRHSAALIERAAHDARAFLDNGGSERPPIRMRMHRHGEYPRSHAGEGGVQVRDLRLHPGRGDAEEPRAPAA